MKKLSAFAAVVLSLLLLLGCQKEELTAVSDSLSLALPRGIVSFTAEEAAKNEQIRPLLEAVSDSAENLYIGALPAAQTEKGFGVIYIIQREKEDMAATGVSNIGAYADTNEFAYGLAEWYKQAFPDFYVVDVLSGRSGAPVFVVHVQTEEGMALLGETYSTDYSDSIIACFFDESGKAAEPTQAQYSAFTDMLKTVTVK